MARKRKPTHLHEVQGTKRNTRHTPDPVVPDAQITVFPDMSEDAIRIWTREIGPLLEAGILKQTDRVIFRMLCEAIAEYEMAIAEIARVGYLIQGRYGTAVRSPWIAVRNQARSAIYQYVSELGMTPAARAKLTGEKGDSPRRGFADLDA